MDDDMKLRLAALKAVSEIYRGSARSNIDLLREVHEYYEWLIGGGENVTSECVNRIRDIVNFNIADVINFDENDQPFIDVKSLSREQMSGIRSIDIDEQPGKTKVRIVTHDAVEAAELLLNMESE